MTQNTGAASPPFCCRRSASVRLLRWNVWTCGAGSRRSGSPGRRPGRSARPLCCVLGTACAATNCGTPALAHFAPGCPSAPASYVGRQLRGPRVLGRVRPRGRPRRCGSALPPRSGPPPHARPPLPLGGAALCRPAFPRPRPGCSRPRRPLLNEREAERAPWACGPPCRPPPSAGLAGGRARPLPVSVRPGAHLRGLGWSPLAGRRAFALGRVRAGGAGPSPAAALDPRGE